MTSSAPADDRHVPVMRDAVVQILRPALEHRVDTPGSGSSTPVYVDATLGMGGHAEAILEAAPQARVVGIDRDTEALQLAGERLARFGSRFTAVHAVYDDIPGVLDDLGLPDAQAILLDLGVSSLQLDEVERGFSYSQDAPLDMRMDQTQGITAAEVLNTYAAPDLIRILRDYGEERFARRVVSAVERERERRPFDRSGRLVELLRQAVPAASQRTGGHPAKRTFQALRIEVNAELRALEDALPAAVEALGVGGRVAVLSYHSLEDRMVKRTFASGGNSTAPAGLPVELPEHEPYLRLLVRGQVPDHHEIALNPRAGSARLRVAERLRPTPAARTKNHSKGRLR